MSPLPHPYAERGVSLLAAVLERQPPPGVTAPYVSRFFAAYRAQLVASLAQLLDQIAARQLAALPSAPPVNAAEFSVADMPADEWPQAARTKANLAALRIMSSGMPLGPAERTALLRYSGFGGLSLEAVADQFPPGWQPEARGLIHEYYTPTKVATEIARVLRPYILGLPSTDGEVLALEPAAGIGRLVHALSGSGFEALRWTAVEYSHVSARILAAVRPDLSVMEGPFERWIAQNELAVRGKLGLVVSNPPYGMRGASLTEDPNKGYREKKAYAYFLRRVLDLLAASGIGVFLIPYGFLTGKSAALVALRERVLKRHHLMAAFRLPSRLFPGANLVTDLLFFRARGGELPALLPDDLPVVHGRYLEQFPQHLLGTERGTKEDEDDTTRAPRRGYEVDGEFTALPDFVERSMCVSCSVAPFYTAAERPRVKPARTEDLPAHVASAIALGERVVYYLSTLAREEEASTKTAAALYSELREALLGWGAGRAASLGRDRALSPHADRQLVREAKHHAELLSFLSAFAENGELVPVFQTPPVYTPRFQGRLDDVAAQAEFLYRTRRRLTLDMLRGFRAELGVADLNDPLHTTLIVAGWCFDMGEWHPTREYYTGSLWPKYDRAKALADQGDAQAAVQAAQLLAALSPARFADIAPEPRMPWVPLSILRAWLEEWTDAAVSPLLRDNGLLRLEESTYTDIKDVAGMRLAVAFGYLNHDFTLFTPPATKRVDPTTGEEESAAQALSRTRLDYGERARRSFLDFVGLRPELVVQLEEAYNRLFRGYVAPDYSAEDLAIARWRGRIVLKPHQRAGAQRLIANLGGLLGFDVGVGKTYTGIATIAALRQIGRARRPIVIVPNTLIWKWHKDLRAALPDYRIGVAGSERYIGRSGVYTSRIDTPQERATKWRQFQAGDFDVMLVTYSVFARNSIRAESVRAWIMETPALLRMIGLDARNLLAGVKEPDSDDKPKKKRRPPVSAVAIEKLVGAEKAKALSDSERANLAEGIAMQREQSRDAENAHLFALIKTLTDKSERERAIFGEALERWIAERLESPDEPDPGIYWEDLQCDLLVLDEAQNMKNLWPVQQREGGVPKYLGAISEGSDRAWSFALRAALVRMRTGGSGVVLLSATPAKNSPLEYYTLLGYVDGEAWSRLGITDPEIFIDRYLRLEIKDIIGTDLKPQRRSVVAGFKNLDELRDVIFRYAEFRTAEEVGLKLPETQVEQIRVAMSEAQADKYERYLNEYENALKRGREDPRMRLKALGLLQRMALVAIHPELDAGPLNKEGKPEWTWQNARQVKDPACPKLLQVRDLILAKPDCGHLVFCDNVPVHLWLLLLLTEAGFPGERVAIFNADQAPNPARRQLLSERFNGVPPVLDENGNVEQEGVTPQYDVVIANATAYEGIDLHVRTCQVYHIDLPWEPATLQQRNGRAVRQGNLQAVIRIFYLLSERSMDAVRFSMILGKLGWMKDILKSADRETNNPGAQAEMNPEELLLYLARDPEQARAAIEQQKKMLVEETRQRVRRQAWTSLRGLLMRAQSLARVTDEMQRTQIHNEMEELRGYLTQVPPETWPWFFLADLAQAGTPMLFGPDWALPQGGTIFREAQGVELGEVRGDFIGVRFFGDFRWHGLSVEKLATGEPGSVYSRMKDLLGSLGPEDLRYAVAVWNRSEDEQALALGLRSAIDRVRSGDFDALGLDLASPRWRTWLWEHYRLALLDALGGAPASLAFRVPIAPGAARPPLQLVSGAELRSRLSDVLPLDPSHFTNYVDLAPTSGYKWAELNATSLAWWGRPFPRGILREADSGSLVEIRTSQGTQKVRAVWQSPYFAVTYSQGRGPDHPDGPLFGVSHLPSGKSAAQAFLTADAARVAAQYLASIPAGWESETPDTSRLPSNLSAVLSWIRSQKEPPTLADVIERASA